MYRIRRNVDVLAKKVDGNDDEVMDVLHVITNAALGEVLRGAISDNNVTRCTTGNLIRDVAWNAELAVVPPDFNLRTLSALRFQTHTELANFLAISRY